MANNFNIAKILGELFMPKSADFFIYLLVQQGALSAVFYALNIPEIFYFYCNPFFAFESRKMYNDVAAWRRDETLTFTYGYFNSQIMTMFTICIFYSPTVPLVPMAAFAFVHIRHYVDSYNLLTYYRKEIDSSGKTIDYITNTALLIIMFYQICMTAYFAIHNRRMETLFCSIVFLISVFFSAISYEDIFDLARIEGVISSSVQQKQKEDEANRKKGI